MPHYNPTPDRPAEYGNGVSTEYRGFTITDTFDVLKGGKVIWQCTSVQDARSIIDQSEAMRNRPNLQAALTKMCEVEEENGEERREREAEQVNNYYENENYKHESI